MKATFTYEVITEESAEQGDVEEHGWITPGHREYALQDADGYHKEVLEQAQAGEFDGTDLSTVVRFAQELGIHMDWTTGDFRSVDPDHGDYSTGEERFYSLHLTDVTPSTYRRIARLIRGS